MKKANRKILFIAISMLTSFILWTVLIGSIDIKAIGPQESTVGFATLNKLVHNITGVNMSLYYITDWLGLVPIGFALGFAFLGVVQWVKRRHIKNIDHSILLLGGFYTIVIAVYIFFESVVINYRPVLINGILEASYPSSTTMIVMCVMPTVAIQFNSKIKNISLKHITRLLIYLFTAFMVIGRLVSGVHWFTDIIGGALLSIGLVMLYYFFYDLELKKHNKN